MIRVSRTIEIEAPPEKIWTFIEDPARELKWRHPEVRELELVDEGPVAAGSRYRGKTRILGMTDNYSNLVTEFDPPYRIAWRYVDTSGMMAANGYYQLTPIGDGGSRFKISLEYHPRGWMGRLAEPMMSLLAGPILQRFAERLKELSEDH